MIQKAQLTAAAEKFYVDVVEEFREIELKIIADSKFNSFRKRDYDGNIEALRLCRKAALDVETGGFDSQDTAEREVIRRLERAIGAFCSLCDAHIQLQTALKRKANREELKLSVYREIFGKVEAARERLNDELHELDIVYTDFTYDEEGEKWEMKTL